ncbi:unnamed protein product [Chilo suppressalis]|uniref:MADF domain-containing protein n=1 Tax=Chilo suppressalis TaxID=168631 RepID=A0ABN8AWE9_CHISP|nr:unnamed protein product [Chilo suppressalis]
MDIEEFIECVKKYPILYNTRHKEYKNLAKKADVWEIVASEMGESSEVLRTKWKGLKDGYTKYKKQNQGEGGTFSSKTFINWRWGPNLTFLDDFVREKPPNTTNNRRDSATDISILSQDDSVSHSPVSESSHHQTIPVTLILESMDDDTLEYDQCISLDPIISTPTPPKVVKLAPRPSHKVSGSSQSPAVSTKQDDDVEKILSFLRSKHNDIKKCDAVDDLFKSYAKTFRNFSVQTQTVLKVEMAKLFANAELREYKMNNN